jgi:hypothetical protein
MVSREEGRSKRKPSQGYDYAALPLRALLAVLVHCVYFRDVRHRAAAVVAKLLRYENKDAEELGRQHWQPMGCAAIKAGADELRHLDDAEMEELGLAVYLRKDPPGGPHPNVNAPGLAIVLRGTLLHFGRDLAADANIALDRLHESKRVARCRAVILKVVRDFLRGGGRQDQICMAGHSLGAGIALLVGKDLASEHDILIDTHLFNPPLLTLTSFATGEFLPGSKSQALLDATIRSWASKLFDGAGVSNAVDPARERKLDAEWERFKKLRDWIPHFYLNPRDLVCLQYVHYYGKQHQMATKENVDKSRQARITRRVFKRWLQFDVNFISNVVPSADVWISRQYRLNLVKAHSLKQWHRFPESGSDMISLEFQPRLLGGDGHAL